MQESAILIDDRRIAEQLYLKNARAEKDVDGNFWQYIESGDLSAMFCLSYSEGADEDCIERRALAGLLTDQDSL